jgi:biopolymer transport protein ExbB
METEATSWLSWWENADWIIRSVFVLLIGLSVTSWSIIFYKVVQFAQAQAAERAFARMLRNGEAPRHPLFHNLSDPNDQDREARLHQALTERRLSLEGGLTPLATIGNSAPFIGLFGTVWGIMHALQALGGTSTLTMALIAGPVAEALVATAAGLFTAIPAVVGYNLLLRRLRLLMVMMEGNALLLSRPARSEDSGRVTVLRRS